MNGLMYGHEVRLEEEGDVARMKRWQRECGSEFKTSTEDLPEYLGLIKDVQKAQELFRSHINDIRSELEHLNMESAISKNMISDLLAANSMLSGKIHDIDEMKKFYIIAQDIEQLKRKVQSLSPTLILKWDFLLAVCMLIAGIIFLLIGTFSRFAGYIVTGIVSIVLAVLHLSSLEK